MKIIVGLGNPGEKYKNNRHNAGFMAVDFFATSYKLQATSWQNNFDSALVDFSFVDKKIILAKPQTFMNESGIAVKQLCDFYKIDTAKDLLIVHDDTDLPLGTIRYTDSSSSAGHNGVADIIEKLGTQDFHRIRIGVESRESRNDLPTDAFVLQNFTSDELKKLEANILPQVKTEIEKFLAK